MRERNLMIHAEGFGGVARVLSMLQSRRYDVCAIAACADGLPRDIWSVRLTVRSGEPEAQLLQRRLDRMPAVLSAEIV